MLTASHLAWLLPSRSLSQQVDNEEAERDAQHEHEIALFLGVIKHLQMQSGPSHSLQRWLMALRLPKLAFSLSASA